MTVLLAGRLVLAGVFALAALGKLFDLTGARRAAREFGVPRPLVSTFALALPLCELAIAVALVPVASAWLAAVLAAVLLLGFVAAIARAMVRGERPDCHCFGQIHSSPAGFGAIARNVGLACLAGLIAVQGRDDAGASATHWLTRLDTTQAVGLAVGAALVLAVALLAWFCFELLRQNGRLLGRIEEVERSVARAPEPPVSGVPALELGAVAPPFELPDLSGELESLESLAGGGKPVLLVFSDPHCGPCDELLPELAGWQREHAESIVTAVVSRGSIADNRSKKERHGLARVLLQKDREVAAAYLAHGTPSAVLVSPEGRIAAPLAAGAGAIRALVAQATNSPRLVQVPAVAPRSRTPAVGERGAQFALPDLDGGTFRSRDLRGTRALLVFWDPGCGFCERMLEDLRRLDSEPPDDAPELIVLSRGSAEQGRAMGLYAQVLLDAGGKTARSYGADGTPMAVLLDPEGLVASELAVGAAAVLALAGVQAEVSAA